MKNAMALSEALKSETTSSHLDDAMSALDRAVSILGNNLESLEERLRPLLANIPAQDTKGIAVDTDTAPHINAIRLQAERINTITDSVSFLLQRLCS